MTVITAYSNPQSSNLLRILTAGILAVSVTFGLFFLMQMLLATDFVKPVKTPIPSVHIGKIRITQPPVNKIKAPEKPVTQNIPETPATPIDEPIGKIGIPTAPPPTAIIIKGSIKGLNAPDGEIQPYTYIAPPYPNSMLVKGIEGYVIVRFDVTEIGKVVKASIIESTHRAFEGTSLKTIKRFKYKPQIRDGVPQYTADVLYRFTFTIKK